MESLVWNVISCRQYVAWKFLDGKVCFIKYMKTLPAPMPWSIPSKN